MKKIGKRIREKRLLLKIKQSELASIANVSQGYISEVEKGIKNPTLNFLQKIAIGLNCSVSDFISGLDNENDNANAVSK